MPTKLTCPAPFLSNCTIISGFLPGAPACSHPSLSLKCEAQLFVTLMKRREMQKTKPKKLLTTLQIASGLLRTNRIELATCKLRCLFYFPADMAFHAPPRLHKAVLPFMKTYGICNPIWDCPASHCVGVRP